MTDQMTGRPRTVSGTAGSGRLTTPLVPTVLLADADEDARAMLRDALLEGTGPTQLRTVSSAGELESYLRDPDPASAKPALVLVDHDLPAGGDDALQVVARLKADADLRHIPVVVLARNPDPMTTAAAYEAGANTFIPKPVTFLALVRLMKVFTAYWLDAAALPPQQELP
jgi:CheY-like chemotaxis protein